ncbi:MAG: M20/M25/M40 family metallo-hydrolase [Bacillota bacterium]
MVNRERIISEFIELTSIDSVTKNERVMADTLKRKLGELGYEAAEDDAGEKIGGKAGNLVCNIKGTKDVPPVMLVAHMDTVEPGTGKKPVEEGGKIRSNGDTVLGADDVAGIACILETLRAIKENNIEHGDIQAVFTVAEECGLLGAKNLDYGKIYAKYCFVLDSEGPIGTVAVKAPSHNGISVTVKGRASHAGITPEKGINAIQIAAAAIAGMKLGRIDEETTANIGVINGGRATNIVCESVDIKGEARSRDSKKLEDQTAHMKECFEQAAAKYGGTVDFKAELEYPSFSIDNNSGIMGILKKAADEVKIELNPQATGGGSDTNIINSKGIEAVNVSVGMENVHSVEEFIVIDNLVKAAEFVLAIIKNIS